MEIQRGDRRGRSAAEKANLTKLLEYPRRKENHPCLIVGALPKRIHIPLTIKEAMASPDWEQWKSAIDEEIRSIREYGTFSDAIEKPKELSNHELVTAKFVFDIKYSDTGEITRYKARLVARGFTQIHGINYEETFAPTLAFDAFRTLLATAAKNNWSIRQMDVVTAFLAGTLKEKVILRVPENLQPMFGDFVQVIKSIYGLKQAARVWFQLLQSFLQSIGFKSSPTDESVMIYKSSNAHIVIGIYVDDLLITGSNQEEIEKITLKIKNRFKMKDLGPARNVLGMRILRNGDKLSLDQSRYAAEIVHEFYYEDGLIYATPMATNAVAVLENDSDKNLTTSQADAFLRLIGKLN
ncbi:hypothetical protein K3495_g12828 [Podosphaera aphanis]|nr:hypothetical protein K3495_g12828 [Podosphaera aphanis]